MFEHSDPVLFKSTKLENANMVVLHCREVLEQTGMTAEATRLKGLEVTNQNVAHLALQILNAMTVKAEAAFAKQLATDSLRDALNA